MSFSRCQKKQGKLTEADMGEMPLSRTAYDARNNKLLLTSPDDTPEDDNLDKECQSFPMVIKAVSTRRILIAGTFL